MGRESRHIAAVFPSRRRLLLVASAGLTLLVPLLLANAQMTTAEKVPRCVVRITDTQGIGSIYGVSDTSAGVLIAASTGLYRFDGLSISTRVPGSESLAGANSIWDTKVGIVISGGAGLFRYDGSKVSPIADGSSFEAIPEGHDVQDTAFGVIVNAGRKVFRYDGTKLLPIPGEFRIGDTKAVVLGFNDKGLFKYDGSEFVAIPGGDSLGSIHQVQDTKLGILVAADNGLFRYNNSDLIPISDVKPVFKIWDRKVGVLFSTGDSVFRYDGLGTQFLFWGGSNLSILDTKNGVLVFSQGGGIFRSDGSGLVPLFPDAPFNSSTYWMSSRSGVLFSSDRGLSLYDETNVIPILGGDVISPTEIRIWDTQLGAFIAAFDGDYVLVDEPLSTVKVVLDNWKDIDGAGLTRSGLPTRWTITDRCAEFAGDLGLMVVPSNNGSEGPAVAAVAGKHSRDQIWVVANVPVTKAGKWFFRVISSRFNATVGKPSEPITITAPGFLGWVASWWRAIIASSAILLVSLNLIILALARYSSATWRLATDAVWGGSILLPQRLLLSHSQFAQLWLLDLYVQQKRKAQDIKMTPFLSFPLVDSRGNTANSDAILTRFGSLRHVWLQGNAGMGKTTTFNHLRETYFGLADASSFACFRRFGYVLVPIEARRFSDALSSNEKTASDWIVACVRSVLSEGGLLFDDPKLLHAVLSKGTLAVAIDGLNEVARQPAVAAFVAEFPNTPLFVTSQESGESPFEVWRLPRTIGEHVDGLLRLYLGSDEGKELGRRLLDSGLTEYLRSGYDVRLVIELVQTHSKTSDLPKDRLDLYESAVQAAWPESDDRRELLEASAWKLLSERGPNEDKRRLVPDQDAPGDLLAQLEAVRERSGRSIRLVRLSPLGYEFVHDQMNSYLAACWFVKRPTMSVMQDLLNTAKIWQEQRETQRSLWDFVAEMRDLDFSTLEGLWLFAGDDDRRTILGVALAKRAARERWTLTRRPSSTANTHLP